MERFLLIFRRYWLLSVIPMMVLVAYLAGFWSARLTTPKPEPFLETVEGSQHTFTGHRVKVAYQTLGTNPNINSRAQNFMRASSVVAEDVLTSKEGADEELLDDITFAIGTVLVEHHIANLKILDPTLQKVEQ